MAGAVESGAISCRSALGVCAPNANTERSYYGVGIAYRSAHMGAQGVLMGRVAHVGDLRDSARVVTGRRRARATADRAPEYPGGHLPRVRHLNAPLACAKHLSPMISGALSEQPPESPSREPAGVPAGRSASRPVAPECHDT
jgi:hypothetical protein